MNALPVSTSGRFIIGIDASRSVAPQPTGTELYSRYLIEALLERAPERLFFRLYFNQPLPSAISDQPPGAADEAISDQRSAISHSGTADGLRAGGLTTSRKRTFKPSPKGGR